MKMMIATLPKVLYYGTKIVFRSIRRSILEEIEQSKEAARIRYKERSLESTTPNVNQISLDEAMRILNVEKLSAQEVEEKYKYLFQVNRQSQSGSFYLESKIFRAKERIDAELNNALRKDLVR